MIKVELKVGFNQKGKETVNGFEITGKEVVKIISLTDEEATKMLQEIVDYFDYYQASSFYQKYRKEGE